MVTPLFRNPSPGHSLYTAMSANASPDSFSLADLLHKSGVPEDLSTRIEESFKNTSKLHRQQEWMEVVTQGGFLCELLYRFIQWTMKGIFTPVGTYLGPAAFEKLAKEQAL